MAAAPTHQPDGTCRSCPVSPVIATVTELQPEAAAHPAGAGRELALASRAVSADVAPDDGPDVYERDRRGTSPATADDRVTDADGRPAALARSRRIAVDGGAAPADPFRDS